MGAAQESEPAMTMPDPNLSTRSGAVPEAIAKLLRRLLFRTRLVIFLRGICAVLGVGIGTALAAMGLDFCLVLFNAWERWTLSAVLYACVAGAGWRFLVHPLARSFTPAGIARMIEANHPEMQERLSSAIELLTSKDAPDLRGSQVLIQALTDAAVKDAALIKPRQELSLRAAARPFAFAAALLAALALLAAAWPARTGFLLTRAAAPFLNLSNLAARDLTVTPGDITVAHGNRLDITVATARLELATITLLRRQADGRESRDEMARVPRAGGQRQRQLYTYSIPILDKGFQYRILADHALTRHYTVKVEIPAAIHQVDLKLDYPEYAHLPPKLEANSSGAISALAGTRVTLTAKVSKRVLQAEMQIAGQAPRVVAGTAGAEEADGSIPYRFEFLLEPGLAGIYSLRFKDDFGLENNRFERPVQALPDLPPTATLDPSRRELRLTRGDRLPVACAATDDIGLANVVMLLEADATTLPPRPFTLTPDSGAEAPASKSFAGTAVINFADDAFKTAARVTVRIRAADHCPVALKGPQTGLSDPLAIIFDDQAKPFKEQALEFQVEQTRKTLERIRDDLTRAGERMEPIRATLEKEDPIQEQTAKTIEENRGVIADANRQLHELADKNEGGFFDALPKDLRQIADEPVNRSQSQLGQIKLADKQADRVALAEGTATNLKKAVADLNASLKKLDTAARETKTALELEALATKQAALAHAKAEAPPPPAPAAAGTPPEATPPDPAAAKENAEWQRQQETVAARVAELVKHDPAAAASLAELNQKKAEAMAGRLRELAERQTQAAAAAPNALRQTAQEQAGIAAEAQETEKEAGQLRDQARNTTPDGTQPPAWDEGRINQPLNQAREQAATAANGLKTLATAAEQARAKPEKPLPASLADDTQNAQRQAAENFKQAAAGLEAMAAGFQQQAADLRKAAAAAAAAAAPPPPGPPPTADGQPGTPTPTPAGPAPAKQAQAAAMAQAASKTAQAAQTPSAATALQAAQALQAAAAAAASQAMQGQATTQPKNAAGMIGAMAAAGPSSRQPRSPDAAVLLKRFGLRLQDWQRLPGSLRDEILQSAVADGPEEYRPLIKRYFEELSKQAP
jgi:hypothetical protein